MPGFSFETTPKVICEDGCSARLGDYLRTRNIRHALIVTDPFIAKSGLLTPVEQGLRRNAIGVSIFDKVQADPPEASVEQAIRFAGETSVDAIIGFGGGSAMDTAKLVALLADGKQSLTDVYGIELAEGPRLPLVQVPTTAGTGSEVTSIAIVTTPDSEKKGVISSHLYPDAAFLDASLTLGLPPRVTAMTGIDAIVHAVEAFTSKHKKNPVSDGLARSAIALLAGNIRQAVDDGSDLDARRAMLQGSLLAGMAFANAPVGAVHALAYPLGGHFHIPHGHSNALVFAPVVAFNLSAAAPLYAELAAFFPDELHERRKGADAFHTAVRSLVTAMPIERRLGELGIGEQHISMLATDAMKVERLLRNNPATVGMADAAAIYRSVLH